MLSKARPLALAAVWTFGLLLSVFAARYFLVPVPLLRPPLPPEVLADPTMRAVGEIAPYLYAEHRGLLLGHIAVGIVALSIGLFQFVGRLRPSRPVHRLLGRA